MSYYQTNTGSYAPTQDGYTHPLFTTWIENTNLYMKAGAYSAGMVFQLLSRFDPQRGLPLDPPGFQTLSLTLVQAGGSSVAGTLGVYMVPSYAPAVYSNGVLPGARFFTADVTVDAIENGQQGSRVWRVVNMPEPGRNGEPHWRLLGQH